MPGTSDSSWVFIVTVTHFWSQTHVFFFFGLAMMTEYQFFPKDQKSFRVISTGFGLLRHHLYSHTYQNPLDTRKVRWMTVLSLRECSSFPTIRCNSLGFASPLTVFWRSKRIRDRSYLKYIYIYTASTLSLLEKVVYKEMQKLTHRLENCYTWFKSNIEKYLKNVTL